MADTNKRSGGVKNTDYVNYDWNGSGENTNYVNSIKVLNSLKKVVTMAIHSTETVIPNMKNDKFVEISAALWRKNSARDNFSQKQA